ncbi:MAG: hypothetical protein OHK005_19160 [Candidatus Methylacidiphilales bacterium]
MEGDYTKFNRFLAIIGLLGMAALGLAVTALAHQHGVTDWDAEKVKTALIETGNKAAEEVGKFFGREPKKSSGTTGSCER